MNHMLQPMVPHNAPPRVSMAFQVLTTLAEGMAVHVNPPPFLQEAGGVPQSPPEPYKRTDEETACYKAALQCLVRYFTGELSYGDVEPNSVDKFVMTLDSLGNSDMFEGITEHLVNAIEKIEAKRDEIKAKRKLED